MNIVLCWCCKHYLLDSKIKNDGTVGFCEKKKVTLSCNTAVCEDFILRDGLYTHRTIPKYCKQYFKHR